MCDSTNRTRFLKEGHLPYCASRDNQVKKGDRVQRKGGRCTGLTILPPSCAD